LFENRAPRGIFGIKREEITEDWRKLHIDQLHKFSSPLAIRVIKSGC
jgi:hypothetical protein